MKWAKDALRRWKERNWDRQPFVDEGHNFVHLGFKSPRLRAFWDKRGKSVITASKWLLALIGGALILRFLGLG